MQYTIHQTSESGFTLVELAIVMLIIGLLVGGVLKGQELIESARVSSTVQAMESFDAAFNTFNDRYAAIPGDVPTPADRIPNCAGSCDYTAGTQGDQQIEQTAGDAQGDGGTAVWAQLSAAGLISGASPDPANNTTVGESAPEADIGGGFIVGWNDGDVGHLNNSQHYLYIARNLNSGIGAGDNAPMTPTQAAQIDRKLDDGLPKQGAVRVSNTSDCGDGENYNTANTNTVCSIYKETIN